MITVSERITKERKYEIERREDKAFRKEAGFAKPIDKAGKWVRRNPKESDCKETGNDRSLLETRKVPEERDGAAKSKGVLDPKGSAARKWIEELESGAEESEQIQDRRF